MNLFSPIFWVLLLNLSAPTTLPTLEVQVLVGTAKPNATFAGKMMKSAEISQIFGKHNLKYFYLFDELTISFSGPEQSQGRVLSLPKNRSAHFVYMGQTNSHHILEFSLPDYDVMAQLKVPESRTFYQAGMKHDDGMIILKMRLNPFKK